MIVAGQAAAAVPLAALPVTAPAWLALAWYPALALGWRRFVGRARPPAPETGPMPELRPLRPARHRSELRQRAAAAIRVLARPLVGAAAVAALLIALTVGTLPDGRLHLVMLDIGQGDAILVTAPSGETALIDGGPDPDLLLRRLGERLPWWQRRIDVMILTHPHQDHVAGLVAALERYRVGLILDTGRDYANPTYPRFLELARQEPGARLLMARVGQRLRLGGTTTLSPVYPTAADVAGPLPEGDINNASVVALLRYGGFTALLTGDAKASIEALLAARGLLSRVDVLKVGHHGSQYSSSPAFLAATRPRAALISVGFGNAFGHPHQAALDRLTAVPGLRLHRTDLEGSIEVISDGQRYEVRSRLATDPWRPVVGAAIPTGRAAGSIGPWPSPPSPRPTSCSPPSTCPMASSPTRAASPGWRRRRRGSWQRPGSRWIRSSSRSPPCCTTSTSHRHATTASGTGRSPPSG
jgi:competence protein ComEC